MCVRLPVYFHVTNNKQYKDQVHIPFQHSLGIHPLQKIFYSGIVLNFRNQKWYKGNLFFLPLHNYYNEISDSRHGYSIAFLWLTIPALFLYLLQFIPTSKQFQGSQLFRVFECCLRLEQSQIMLNSLIAIILVLS